MFGALVNKTIEARARREVLLAQAATERQHMAGYLDAFDPATVWLERLIAAVQFILARPVIPAGVLAAIVILKPRRVIKVALLAWKALSWVKRLKTAFS